MERAGTLSVACLHIPAFICGCLLRLSLAEVVMGRSRGLPAALIDHRVRKKKRRRRKGSGVFLRKETLKRKGWLVLRKTRCWAWIHVLFTDTEEGLYSSGLEPLLLHTSSSC